LQRPHRLEHTVVSQTTSGMACTSPFPSSQPSILSCNTTAWRRELDKWTARPLFGARAEPAWSTWDQQSSIMPGTSLHHIEHIINSEHGLQSISRCREDLRAQSLYRLLLGDMVLDLVLCRGPVENVSNCSSFSLVLELWAGPGLAGSESPANPLHAAGVLARPRSCT